MISPETQEAIRKRVETYQGHGYSKYATAKRVGREFGIYYERATHYVRKFWSGKFLHRCAKGVHRA